MRDAADEERQRHIAEMASLSSQAAKDGEHARCQPEMPIPTAPSPLPHPH